MSDVVTENPLNRHLPWSALDEQITPIEVFFCRNHYEMPEAPHQLQWGEQVLNLEQLQELPRVRRAITLECAGNGRTAFSPVPSGTPWERRGLSTAWFSGPTVDTLLERWPTSQDWKFLIFQGADDGKHGPYARSLSRDEVVEFSPFLALEMNDAPLPYQHGGPMRLIVPGYYAMSSVKWLQSFSFSDEPCPGYYQQEDYLFVPLGADRPERPVTTMRAKSLFSLPLDGAEVRSPVKLRGKAWSGQGPVEAVEIELAGKRHPARLVDDLGRWAWRSFELEIDLPPGRYQAAAFCRAAGVEQPREAPWNRQGYENNSAHGIEFTVV